MNGLRGLALLFATVGLLAAAPPIAAAIVAPEPDGGISINATPNPITFGAATTISGTRIRDPRDGTYRARVHHDADHAGGTSNRQRADVG